MAPTPMAMYTQPRPTWPVAVTSTPRAATSEPPKKSSRGFIWSPNASPPPVGPSDEHDVIDGPHQPLSDVARLGGRVFGDQPAEAVEVGADAGQDALDLADDLAVRRAHVLHRHLALLAAVKAGEHADEGGHRQPEIKGQIGHVRPPVGRWRRARPEPKLRAWSASMGERCPGRNWRSSPAA